jgi:hypothetical protein
MFGWLEELYRIRREHFESLRHCESCEVLKVEIAQVRREKEILLQHVLHPKDQTEPPMKSDEVPRPIFKGHTPWRVKQQELETQDKREHARIMQEFQAKVNPVNPAVTDKLEKEMGIADG